MKLDNLEIDVLPSEFQENNNYFENIYIKDKLGYLERIISLIIRLSALEKKIILCNITHGGFIFIKLLKENHLCRLLNINKEQQELISKNSNSLFTNMTIDFLSELESNDSSILFCENSSDLPNIYNDNNIILTSDSKVLDKIYHIKYQLSDTPTYLYLPEKHKSLFHSTFHFYLNKNILYYDNLINLCIMVKDAGPGFEEVLTENMKHIDKWTILDTGSTDETINIIKKVLVKKPGNLYQEPFINFRDSRNRLLELAGKDCKYLMILDDTYIIQGKYREFLSHVRGHVDTDSYNLFISTDDVHYASNRILKSDRELKYIYKIHEVINPDNNKCYQIPFEVGCVYDKPSDYMCKRTYNRKLNDLTILFDEIKENPEDPRAYYYLGETYKELGNYESSLDFYLMRVNKTQPGYIGDKVDALLQAGIIAMFNLKKPFDYAKQLFLGVHELEPLRPDPIYCIGLGYYNISNFEQAYIFLKKAFEIGYQREGQFSVKRNLIFKYLPYYLTDTSYRMKDYLTGLKCCELYLNNNIRSDNFYSIMESWYEIHEKLIEYDQVLNLKSNQIKSDKNIFCIIADGGYNKWDGRDINLKGVGGSETWVIEMARNIQKLNNYDVYVICNCEEPVIFENVYFLPLSDMNNFIITHNIESCIVSRFAKYLPLCYNCNNIQSIYFILHDTVPIGEVIPMHDKLRQIFCLTEWHVNYFKKLFPLFENICTHLYYGVDMSRFHFNITDMMKKNKFIYSSFPNRGLLQLLQMWPKIISKFPDASLYIYGDINGSWVNNYVPQIMREIKLLFEKYDIVNNGLNIFYHSWVDKKTLAESWKSAQFWFYPCTFSETFCLTALEAAATKTLAITNGLAALSHTVGERGITIPGDCSSNTWQEKALFELFSIMEDESRQNKLVEENYKWVSKLSWEAQAKKLFDEHLSKQLNVNGLYNWTHDIPKNSKIIFLEMLDKINRPNPHILEVGTYAGISIIEILKRIPNSTGIAIDRWENYNEFNNDALLKMQNTNIESIFNKNCLIANMEDRIKPIKGDSMDILCDLMTKGVLFDFIYIDGSHRCLDVILDLCVSWKLLKKDGIMAIDDYLWRGKIDDSNSDINMVTNHSFEIPYYAVNYFIEKYSSEINILDKGYRVFLQKK